MPNPIFSHNPTLENLNFPTAIIGNSLYKFTRWLEDLTQDNYNSLMQLIATYFDYNSSETGQYIRRRQDNAVLICGWQYAENNNQTLVNPYSPASNTYLEGLPPFEFWKIEENENIQTSESGFEPVYKGSIEFNEVLHFLIWYIYYKELNISLYVGRHIFDGDLNQTLFFGYTPAIHGWGPNLALDYSGYILKQIYRASPDNGINKPMIKRERTLLYLLNKINTKWDDLIKNEGAYTWIWFNNCLRNVVHRRIINAEDDVTNEDIWKRILKKMERLTNGKKWVYLRQERGIYPEKMCKTFYSLVVKDGDRDNVIQQWTVENLQMVWVKASKWDTMRSNNELLWDEEEKMWFSTRAKLNVKYRDITGKAAIKTKITNHKFFKDYFKCDTCGYHVDKAEELNDEDLNITSCKFCYPQGLTANAKVTSRDHAYGNYHSHSREWKFFYQRTPLDDPRAFCVGMEIEMHNKDKEKQNEIGSRSAAWSILQAQYAIDDKLNNCYFERDGSLSNGGLEMVTNPMSLAYHQWYWSLMLPEIRKHCVGWNTEQFCGNLEHANNYGIHMTFSRNWWTDLQLARLIKFIDNPDNNLFVRALAQRNAIYNGEMLASTKQVLIEKVQMRSGKIIQGRNRYVPVNVKGKLVEIRFFRSTLNTESFLKNIEWFFSFYDWVKTTPFNIRAADFLMWLATNQRNHGRYSNLIRYLGRDKFPVKRAEIKNPWQKLFVDIRNSKPLVFPILPAVRNTSENILQGDIECV